MISGRPFAAAVKAALPVAAAFLMLTPIAAAQAQGAPRCDDASEIVVLPSPVAPWKGAPLRVIVASEKPVDGEFSLVAPDGSVAARDRKSVV